MAETATVARPYARAAFRHAADHGALAPWSVLLAARARGLGGVLTTLLSRVEPAAAEPL